MNFKSLIGFIAEHKSSDVLFLGLGNEWRGDDAAGLILLRRLRHRPELQQFKFIEAGTNPENYLKEILDTKASVVIVIDTTKAGYEPGTISLLDKAQFARNQISTHAYSIELIEEYICNHYPVNFYYLGIEPLITDFDTSLSPNVSRSLDLFFKNGEENTLS